MGEDLTVTFLDHTADVGFELRARSRAAVFEGAARALAQLALAAEDVRPAEPAAGAATEPLEVRVDHPDDAALLAAWLRELLFQLATRREVPIAARVEALDATSLRARVTFVREPPPVREIKGVTWHGLRMGPRAGGWFARVLLDV